MTEPFEKILGRVNPRQIKIKVKKVPHTGDWGRGSPTSFPLVLKDDTAPLRRFS
jgi:hypothetical protein